MKLLNAQTFLPSFKEKLPVPACINPHLVYSFVSLCVGQFTQDPLQLLPVIWYVLVSWGYQHHPPGMEAGSSTTCEAAKKINKLLTWPTPDAHLLCGPTIRPPPCGYFTWLLQVGPVFVFFTSTHKACAIRDGHKSLWTGKKRAANLFPFPEFQRSLGCLSAGTGD